MIIVDSSIWIDFFNGKQTQQTSHLKLLLGEQLIGVGDLILTEVLQGFRDDKAYQSAKELMVSFEVFDMGGTNLAIQSAQNFRTLRKKGITIRKTIDVIIASFCIENNFSLLFSDRDFEPFVTYLGLKPAFLM